MNQIRNSATHEMVTIDQYPLLYSFRRCPYAMRARLALHVSGTQCVLREIVLRDKAPAFLEVSPKGTVPVVITPDGVVIEESLDVMMWALGRNDPEEWLTPPTADRGAMLKLIQECDTTFKTKLDAYKYASRDVPENGVIARQEGSQFLLTLDARLQEQNYLFGARLSLADMAIFPFVRQFAHVNRAWFDGEPWPALKRWLDELLESARFKDVMKKYAKWQAGDGLTIFP